MNGHRRSHRDSGAILPLVLVVTVVLSVVVVGIATYSSSTLNLGQVVEASSDRVAAAEGGLDWALDRYDRGFTTCGSAVGFESTIFQGEVNGLRAEVTCTLVGEGLPAAADYAVVITGEYLDPDNPPALLTRTGANSEAKEIRGPIYMEAPTIDLSAPINVEGGWLLHNDESCTGSFVESSPTLPDEFTLVAPGRPYCTDQTWHQLFEPNSPVPTLPTAPAPSPVIDPNGCVVWFPGVYSIASANAPDFASSVGGGPTYNYFVSGDYYFDDLGEVSLKGAYVLAGYPGIRGPNIVKIKPQDTFDNHPCREAWWYDGLRDDPTKQGDRDGATWYMGGSSYLFVDSNAAIEITGRRKTFNNTSLTARVSLQTVNPGDAGATTVLGADAIVTTKEGSGSQMAMRGMVWTPHSSFSFDNLANDVVAALQGGAVVASLGAGAAAQTDGFLIEVSSQEFDTQFQVESKATNSGTATVRAIVDYQPTPADVSIISRRVTDITPE